MSCNFIAIHHNAGVVVVEVLVVMIIGIVVLAIITVMIVLFTLNFSAHTKRVFLVLLHNFFLELQS